MKSRLEELLAYRRGASSLSFDLLGLGAALGSLLGVSAESGGWILGGTITIAFFFAGMIIASALHASGPVAGVSLSGSLAIGMGLGTLFGWLPIWFMFFVFIFSLISVMGLLANRGP